MCFGNQIPLRERKIPCSLAQQTQLPRAETLLCVQTPGKVFRKQFISYVAISEALLAVAMLLEGQHALCQRQLNTPPLPPFPSYFSCEGILAWCPGARRSQFSWVCVFVHLLALLAGDICEECVPPTARCGGRRGLLGRLFPSRPPGRAAPWHRGQQLPLRRTKRRAQRAGGLLWAPSQLSGCPAGKFNLLFLSSELMSKLK